MQRIALENNQAETAFLVGEGGHYQLRWFTPAAEVDLCGHATLASAHVVLAHLSEGRDRVTFDTLSGELVVSRQSSDEYLMDFPALECSEVEVDDRFFRAVGVQPGSAYRSTDYVLVLKDERQVLEIHPNQEELMRLDLRGVAVTALGDSADYVARFFAPKLSIPEDSITGSAHCALAPYWAKRLSSQNLCSVQYSTRLGSTLGINLKTTVSEDRVFLGGHAVLYMEGKIVVPA